MANDPFRQAEDQFFLLKGQLTAGRITQQQFDAALKQLMIQDAQGRYWMIGADTGKWYVHDGQTWVEAKPPSASSFAPPPPPERASAFSRPSSNMPIIAVAVVAIVCLLGAIILFVAANQGVLKIGLASPTNTPLATTIPTVAQLPTAVVVVVTATPAPTVALPTASSTLPPLTVSLTPTLPSPTATLTPTLPPPTATLTPTLSVTDLVAQADALTLQSKFADAEALYQQALQMDPANAIALAHWAHMLNFQAYLEERDDLAQLAVTKAEIAAQLAPTNSEVAIWQSRAYDWNGNYDKALIAAQKAVQLAPNSAQANAVLAEAQSDNGKGADADASAQKALQLDPNNADVHRILAYFSADKKQLDLAIAELDKAAQIEPNNAVRYFELGSFYRQAKTYDKSIAAHQKAIALYPSAVRAYLGLGNDYMDQKQYDQAIDAFTHATQINNNFAAAFYSLGQAYYAANQCPQAIPAYQKTIELNPKANLAMTYLGWCQLKAGNLTAAVSAAQQAAAIDPNFADTKGLQAALAAALATPTPPVPPGLYVTAMGMDQPQPAHGQLVNFTVSFLNTSNGNLSVKWKVFIYRADKPAKPNMDSTLVSATFPPGNSDNQPVPMNFKIGSTGNDCDFFFARVDMLDSNNQPTDLTTTDGKVFEKGFSVCK